MITIKVGKKPISKPKPVFESSIEKKREAFLRAAMDIIAQDIVDGILSGQSVAGGPLPELEPYTIMKKGHGRPLVDEGYLSNIGTYSKIMSKREGVGRIRLKPIRERQGVDLQVNGISAKGGRIKKFFRFFGISRDASGRMNDLLDTIMADVLKEL